MPSVKDSTGLAQLTGIHDKTNGNDGRRGQYNRQWNRRPGKASRSSRFESLVAALGARMA